MADFAEETTHRMSLADLRENYGRGGLEEGNCQTNPIVQFERWFMEAQVADLKEPNAMTLSTASTDGRPSGRIVLLKEVSDFGFVFYTNYESRKGQEIQANPFVALTFYWAELERQVRVEGRAEVLSREVSEQYFSTRPKGHRLGAWASNQSRIVYGRQSLESRLREFQALYANSDEVPTPPYWGGYRVVPEAIEFWQGRPNRLHDRIVYRRESESTWTMERLAP